MKNKKSFFSKIIVIFTLVVIFIGIKITRVESAYYSNDIDGINESKYPGYKSKLKALQNTYPKIQLLYTGLDWNDVIRNEYTTGHGKNLVQTSQENEWICQKCKSEKKVYDTGWYCASEDAIKYVMDPRNYLNSTEIFQFQKLNSGVNTSTSDIKKVLQIEKVIYLQNDNEAIAAFRNTAINNKLNVYHLITRVIQEQGRGGTSTLSSGAKYIGTDGVTYEGLYNLFSIGASGNGTETVKTNGLKRASQEGWTTRAKSIDGGGRFVGNNYINVGQNTLYLQKFNVSNTNGPLYYHQYMQNLLAAIKESKNLLSCYQTIGMQNNSDFEFIIPIYENMPKDAIREPTAEYYGSINTELKNIEVNKSSNGNTYIMGSIYIAEWVGNDCRTPRNTPVMTFKSTDGTVKKEMYVQYNGNNIEYYFDRNIEDIDTTKEYYIEVKLSSDKNIAPEESKIQEVRIPNKTLKENFKGKTIKVTNNKIRFSDGNYKGTINTTLNEVKLVQNSKGENYISGYVDIGEYINSSCNAPKTMPEIWLKSTDGKVSKKTYINYDKGITYYFDTVIQNLDLSKKYYLEAILVTEENKATLNERTQELKLGTREIGTFNNIKVISNNNKFTLKYYANINTELMDIKLIQNWKGDNYISGYINIAEWLNGKECRTPSTLPSIKLKSTDGKFETNMYVGYEGGIRYYFDKNINDYDITKEYVIEVVLINKNNLSSQKEKTQQVRIPNKILGINGPITVKSKNNKIIINDSSLYYGTINTELSKMRIIQNGKGDNYISGYIYIAEWVEKECRTPKEMPQIKLKSTDGTYEETTYINHEKGIEYYFDKNIEGLDTTKEYYLEVKLTGKKNTAPTESKTQIAKITPQGQVGICTNGNKVLIEKNKILVQAKQRVKVLMKRETEQKIEKEVEDTSSEIVEKQEVISESKDTTEKAEKNETSIQKEETVNSNITKENIEEKESKTD